MREFLRKGYQKTKAWSKANALVLLYFICAVVMEMTAVFVVEGTPFLRRPFLSLGLLICICGILLLIKNNTARTVVCVSLLFVQLALDLIFSVIYALTDQYFALDMLSLRNDAFGILENLPVDFITFYVGLFFAIALLVLGLRFSRRRPRTYERKRNIFFYVGLILAGLATLGISFMTYYPRSEKDKYDGMLEGKETSAYGDYGMLGNLLGEFGKQLVQSPTTLTEKQVNDFIYAKVSTPTELFGIAKDKNVVTVLAESLEWYTFLLGEEYPNTLTGITQDDLKLLYPNLWELYQGSMVMTNFHSREKTDISETLSIVGSYPTEDYVNYAYAGNLMPQTLPNILNLQTGGNISTRSFHNGFKSFYNRAEAHHSFGFRKGSPIDMYDMEDMVESEEIFKNYGIAERNLDSEMIAAAKNEMFPTNQRFYTYITTITMHGMYYDRANLRPENNLKLAEKLNKLAAFKPTDKSDKDYEYALNLYYYMTTGLEFDYMLGALKQELQTRGLLENTMIVVFGDHNAYYQEMSNYVKGLPSSVNDETEKKFTDLYNVPLMIWDYDLSQQFGGKQERFIDKFACTSDIVPTILDLLGIRYYENLYFGHSIFAPEQSVLYSRAYGIFVGDGIVRRSVTGDLYVYDGLTEEGKKVSDTIADFEKEGRTLVQKIEYCDYIFKKDHFQSDANYLTFVAKMKEINPTFPQIAVGN